MASSNMGQSMTGFNQQSSISGN